MASITSIAPDYSIHVSLVFPAGRDGVPVTGFGVRRSSRASAIGSGRSGTGVRPRLREWLRLFFPFERQLGSYSD